ncbi:MAG: hypothetical protein IPH03_06790 [Tetrasphaera sp.]|jgi:hypothetical protein|nr:hypothetical protein [Tetrasphaera sp.]
MNNREETAVSRRTLAKGAAWAAPTISLGAAAPMFAASTPPPACPSCLKAGQNATGGALTMQGITVLGLSNVTGTAAFNLDSSSCPVGIFQPAYTILGTGGNITWSDGQVTSFLSAQTGAGTLGSISAFATAFTTFGVTMPNDALPPYVKRPTKICLDFTAIFIPILPIPQIECTYTLCWDMSTGTSLGTVILGNGTVNWTYALNPA